MRCGALATSSPGLVLAVLGTALLSTGRSQSVFQATQVINQDGVAGYTWGPMGTFELRTTGESVADRCTHRAEGVRVHEARCAVDEQPETAQTRFALYTGDEVVRIDCEYVVGADGFHGVSRRSIPNDVLRELQTLNELMEKRLP